MSQTSSVGGVLFLINNLNRGGAERAFVRQANDLSRMGIPVIFATLTETLPDGYTSELLVPSSQRIRIAPGLPGVWALHRLVRNRDIEVIYSTLEMANTIARLVKILSPRVRVVTREGSARIDAKGRVSPKGVKYRIIDVLLNWAPKTIVAVSGEIAHALASYQPMYARKIRILENGVTVSEDMVGIQSLLSAKKHRSDFRVLAVASMGYRERAFEYLIDALTHLPQTLLCCTTLVFAGDGKLRSIYENQVQKLNLTERVKFLGRLDTPTLEAEYRSADVFVLCSTAEGSPNVILEAMSFGVPVVSTPVGSAVNFVSDGRTGYLIPFRDAGAIAEKLTHLAEHPEDRETMGLRGYERVSTMFSFEHTMQELRGILGV